MYKSIIQNVFFSNSVYRILVESGYQLIKIDESSEIQTLPMLSIKDQEEKTLLEIIYIKSTDEILVLSDSDFRYGNKAEILVKKVGKNWVPMIDIY